MNRSAGALVFFVTGLRPLRTNWLMVGTCRPVSLKRSRCRNQARRAGAGAVVAMQRKCKFVRVTSAGMRESHVHDLAITREAHNYQPGGSS